MRNGHSKLQHCGCGFLPVQYGLLIILCNITRLFQSGAQERYEFSLMCSFRKMVYQGRMKQLIRRKFRLCGNPSHLLFPDLLHIILNLLYIPGLQHISNLHNIPARKHSTHRNR